jgi:hypothetical protein
MSPFERHSKAIRSSFAEGLPQGNHTTRPRRPDYNELAAQEYRRALRSVLQARGEHQFRLMP